jgi:hypothetical protein
MILIIALQRRSSPAGSNLPTFQLPILPAPYATDDDGHYSFSSMSQPFPPLAATSSPLRSPWTSSPQSGYDYFGSAGQTSQWSGADILTHFPGSAQAPWNTPFAGSSSGLAPSDLPICDENCTLHSDSTHDAVKLLQATHSAPLRFINSVGASDKSEEVTTWLTSMGQSPANPSSGLWPLTTDTQETMYLPITPTQENAELLRICTCPAGPCPQHSSQ